jgi:hypothetical protein
VKRFKRVFIVGIVLSLSISSTTWGKEPATISERINSSLASKAKADAMAHYKRILQLYKSGSLDEVKSEIKKITPKKLLLPRSAQKDLIFIPRTLAGYRPSWWSNMRSSSNVTFKATLWGRPFTANYMPSSKLGIMQTVAVRNGKLVSLVSWRPEMVDNPAPAGGYLAKRHKLSKAALGEAIGWHELGHNYISHFLPLKHVFELYDNHLKLYFHLQEFYADMTSLHHCSPGGRLALMFLRLDGMVRYKESEEHDRAAHAVGAIILANVISYPKKWPSFHFPPSVPPRHIELSTICYLYEQIDTNWTLAADKALRSIIQKFIAANGSKVLRSKGKITLPSRLPFMLMVSDDRKWQTKRDEWVKKKLEIIIKTGRADKPSEVKKRSKGHRINTY